MPGRKLDFDAVRKIAKTLPGVEDSTIHGAPSLKVRGKLLTCPALDPAAEENTLAVRIGFDTRAELMAADPDVYYLTDHYVNYPAVLVRLSRISRDSLRDLLGMAWQFVTAKTNKRPRQVRKQSDSRTTLH
ncbi:MAG TPA: MmcQ/YjbR family DNA-binding protein [Pyrinomonadaceae bacterium]|nr:MmcQ/YjbR family DNA-binding protein [Pyrinomonadaceae bacterium]